MTSNIQPIHADSRSLLERVTATLKREGLSAAKAAREMGVSTTTLSQWLNGRYRGNVDRANALAAAWLRVRDEAHRRGAPARVHAQLRITEEIEELLGYAHARAEIVLVYGAAGSGKTHAATHYRDTHSQVALATMSPAVSTPSAALARVASAIGFSPGRVSSAAALENLLVDRLADRNALLIVDEAHHLSQALLDELRCIHDRAAVGLALLGNEPLWARLAGGERAAQLVSRVAMKLSTAAPATADVDLLARERIGRALGGEEAKLVRAQAKRAGGLRAVNKLIDLAHAFARGEERRKIAAADFAAAAEEAA